MVCTADDGHHKAADVILDTLDRMVGVGERGYVIARAIKEAEERGRAAGLEEAATKLDQVGGMPGSSWWRMAKDLRALVSK